MSVQVSFRWSDDLVRDIDALAEREGRSRSNMAERLIRMSLSPQMHVGGEPMSVVRAKWADATPADDPFRVADLERPFKCRVCEFSAGSEKARCPRHPGALVKS